MNPCDPKHSVAPSFSRSYFTLVPGEGFLAQFHEMGNSVQGQSQSQAGEGQQHKNEVCRLMASQLESVKPPLLQVVDLIHGVVQVQGAGNVEVAASAPFNFF